MNAERVRLFTEFASRWQLNFSSRGAQSKLQSLLSSRAQSRDLVAQDSWFVLEAGFAFVALRSATARLPYLSSAMARHVPPRASSDNSNLTLAISSPGKLALSGVG